MVYSVQIDEENSLLIASIQGKSVIQGDIVIDRAAPKTPLSESSTYLVLTRTVTEQIYKLEIVCATGATTVKLAHNNTNANDAFAVGMALNDAAIGEKVDILIMGVVKDTALAVYPLNATIFLDTNGGTTDVKPTLPLAKSNTIIGRSLGNGEVFVNVQRPSFL